MCGIAGQIGNLLSQDQIKQVYDLLSHRGPDHCGSYTEELKQQNVNLIHTRLSIIDPGNAAQPLVSQDKRFVLVFNGEIYNYLSLKNKLKGSFEFKNNSDSEVLLAAWCAWGNDCLKELEGMFAFALLDRTLNKVYLCRDRFGVKPLYYSLHNGQLFFASELRTLFYLRGIRPKLNQQKIPQFLKHQTVPFNDTLIEGIYSLEPSHYIEYSNAEVNIHRYYQLNTLFSNQSPGSIQSVKYHLIEAVRKRVPEGLDTGLFLSGGIDSTIIALILKKYLEVDVHTFTVGFNNKEFKDKYYAEKVADHLDTRHRTVSINSGQLREEVPTAISSFDHPSADGINTWFISRAVKQHGLTVVLSGQAADEIFGGYDSFKFLSLWDKLRKLGKKRVYTLAKQWYKLGGINQRQFDFLVSDNISHAFSMTREFFNEHQITKLTGSHNTTDSYRIWGETEGLQLMDNPFNFTSFMELTTYLTNVLFRDQDQMSMSHSIEVRSPFIDHKLIESFVALKQRSKFSLLNNKIVLKNLFGKELPKEIFTRKKEGFLMPWEHWMKNELKDYVDDSINLACEMRILNPDGLRNAYHEFKNGSLNWARLWLIITLTRWVEYNKIEFQEFDRVSY